MKPIKGYIKKIEPETDNTILNTATAFNDIKKMKMDTLDMVHSKMEEVDSIITEVKKVTNENTKKIDDKLIEVENTTNEIIKSVEDKLPELQGKDGEDGKDAEPIDEEKLVESIISKLPTEEQLIAKIVAHIPKPIDEKALIKKVISKIPESKASLKVIQEKLEIDPMSVIDKIMAMPEGKFKLKSSQVDGLEQTISAFRTQLSRGYLHGGGLSKVSHDTTLTGDGTVESPLSASGVAENYKLKVTSADTTPDYLVSKILAGTGITVTKENAGGNEDLKIATTITQYTDAMAVNAVAGEGYLTDAPNDGEIYARQCGYWQDITSHWACVAPCDGEIYAMQNDCWVDITSCISNYWIDDTCSLNVYPKPYYDGCQCINQSVRIYNDPCNYNTKTWYEMFNSYCTNPYTGAPVQICMGLGENYCCMPGRMEFYNNYYDDTCVSPDANVQWWVRTDGSMRQSGDVLTWDCGYNTWIAEPPCGSTYYPYDSVCIDCSNNVCLCNDIPNGYWWAYAWCYYGTDGSGNKGWFAYCAGTVCNFYYYCNYPSGSSTDIQTNNGSGAFGYIQGYQYGSPGYLRNDGYGNYNWCNPGGGGNWNWTGDWSYYSNYNCNDVVLASDCVGGCSLYIAINYSSAYWNYYPSANTGSYWKLLDVEPCGGGSYCFCDSITVDCWNNVCFVNDIGNGCYGSYYYGTDSCGNKGWFPDASMGYCLYAYGLFDQYSGTGTEYGIYNGCLNVNIGGTSTGFTGICGYTGALNDSNYNKIADVVSGLITTTYY